MPAPNLVAQQPRWVLLSAFLFLWSLSSGLRRDGPGRALGLGVDARAHLPVADNLVVGDEQEEYASAGIWKRQVGLPNCAALCASQASDTVGCGQGINLACACHSPSFLPDTVNCMDKNCTSIDEQLGQQALQSACEAVGTATSSASTTSASASSTSISSGPPPICTTGSPTTSATTTVSVAVTITSSASGSGSASSDSGSPTSTPPASSQSPSDTTSGSVPVVTTTTMLTTSSTVLIPPDSTTSPPVTTVTSTSTLGSVPSSGTGGDAGTTGTGTGVGDGSTNGAAGSVSAPALGVVVLGSVMLWML